MKPQIKALPELTNLFLARHLALVYGISEPAAIKRCARKIRDRVDYYPELVVLARRLIDAPDHHAVATVENIEANLRKGGII